MMAREGELKHGSTTVEAMFSGNVDFEFGDAANSFVERQNLTVRKCP